LYEIGKIITNALQQDADLAFLGLTIWREARGQSQECQRGVAYSILNRCRKRDQDIMAVVFAPLQYSSLTYKRDPQLTTWPKSSDPSWIQCLRVANEAICGVSDNPVGLAVNYHDISISAPKWAVPRWFVIQIGRIRFFVEGADHG